MNHAIFWVQDGWAAASMDKNMSGSDPTDAEKWSDVQWRNYLKSSSCEFIVWLSMYSFVILVSVIESAASW